MNTAHDSFWRLRCGRVNAALLAVCLAAVVFVIPLALVAYFLRDNGRPIETDTARASATPADRTEEDDAHPAAPAASAAVDATVTVAGRGGFAIVPDDGESLWLPPTDGPPISLAFAPPGGQLFVHLRPAALLSQGEGQRALKALGPHFAATQAGWETATGLSLGVIEQLLLVFVPGPSAPDVVAVAHLVDGVDWEPPGPRLTEGAQRATHLTTFEGARIVLWGPFELVRAIVDREGAPPPLRREVAELFRASDSSRQVNVIGVPHFLFVEGQCLFVSPYLQLRSALQRFCGDQVSAASASLHVVDERACYGELRFVTPVDVRAAAQRTLPNRWRALPSDVEDFLGRLERLDAFWRRVALRFDDMLEFLSRQTRVDFQRSQIVFNFYVPPNALHNLILASELSLAAADGGEFPRDRVQPRQWTIDDALSQRVRLQVPQASLETALEELVMQLNSALPEGQEPFVMRIAGKDLQHAGITRNQQVRDLNLENATVAKALTEVARLANPVTNVTDLSETSQKLVWVVAREPDTKQPVILITTRTAAEDRGDNLPAAFRAK